jgi:hypothetical protein
MAAAVNPAVNRLASWLTWGRRSKEGQGYAEDLVHDIHSQHHGPHSQDELRERGTRGTHARSGGAHAHELHAARWGGPHCKQQLGREALASMPPCCICPADGRWPTGAGCGQGVNRVCGSVCRPAGHTTTTECQAEGRTDSRLCSRTRPISASPPLTLFSTCKHSAAAAWRARPECPAPLHRCTAGGPLQLHAE